MLFFKNFGTEIIQSFGNLFRTNIFNTSKRSGIVTRKNLETQDLTFRTYIKNKREMYHKLTDIFIEK